MAWRFIQALQLVSGKYVWEYGPYIDTIIEKINQGTWSESNLHILGLSAPSGFVITGEEGFGSGEYSVDEAAPSGEYSTIRFTEYNGFIVEFPEYEGHPVGLGYKPSTGVSYSDNYYDTLNNRYWDSEHSQYVYTDRYLSTKWGDQSLKNEFGTAWNNGTLIGFSPNYVQNLENNPKDIFGSVQDSYKHFPGDCSGMFFIADDENEYMQVVHFWTAKYWNGNAYELAWNWSAFAPSGSIATQMNRIYTWLIGSETTPDPDPNDPYTGDIVDGSDQIGGRDIGDTPTEFGITKDKLKFPILDGTGTGFFTAYKIGESILEGIAQRLWNPTFWDSLKEQYRTPAEMFCALYLLPISSRDSADPDDLRHWYANPGDAENIRAGSVVFTGAGTGQRVTRRYAVFNFGKVQINSRWDGYPDYVNYKSIKISIPFCGEFDLDVNDIMSRTENKTIGEGDGALTRVELMSGENSTGAEISLDYVVDTLTGACVARVFVDHGPGRAPILKYQYIGQMAVDLPWSWATSNNAKSTISALLGIIGGAAAVAGSVVTGGASLAIAGGLGITGSIAKGLGPTSNLRKGHSNGSFGSLPGAMESTYPYITVHYQNVVVANNQDHFIGRATPYTSTVGARHGFNTYRNVHLDGIPCTDAERDEIAAILREGVVV